MSRLTLRALFVAWLLAMLGVAVGLPMVMMAIGVPSAFAALASAPLAWLSAARSFRWLYRRCRSS